MKLIDVSTPKFPNTFAMVDDEDFERLNAHKWTPYQAKATWPVYLSRRGLVDGKRRTIHMHREVLGENCAPVIDHRDGNGLNNQKANLRPATAAQNVFNRRAPQPNKSSKYRGVKKDKRRKCESWEARIGINFKNVHIGTFRTEELAYAAYLEVAKRVFGEFVPHELVEAAQGGRDEG